MKYLSLLNATVLALGFCIGMSVYAEETNTEKAEAVRDKAADAAKEAQRDVEDKVCKLVNGKMECAMKKMKHGVQNATDRAKSKANEIKNKMD